ncbi:MAG: GNAT family N-acetyltransferase [Sphingomonas oligoaromativorans]
MVDSVAHTETKSLVTERLLLRAPQEEDLPALVTIAGNLDVSRWVVSVPHPYGMEEARYFLREICPVHRPWAIVDRKTSEFLGIIGLVPIDGENAARFGYYISPAWWLRGVATEAARAVVAHAFQDRSLRSIQTEYFVRNHASARVLQKLGFVEVGEADRVSLATGSSAPVILVRLDQ